MDERDLERIEERQRTAMDQALAAVSRGLEANAGTSYTHCVDCDDEIPEKRRLAIPGVKRCVPCQSGLER